MELYRIYKGIIKEFLRNHRELLPPVAVGGGILLGGWRAGRRTHSAQQHIYICLYMYVCICVYIYTPVNTQVYVCVFMYACVYGSCAYIQLIYTIARTYLLIFVLSTSQYKQVGK